MNRDLFGQPTGGHSEQVELDIPRDRGLAVIQLRERWKALKKRMERNPESEDLRIREAKARKAYLSVRDYDRAKSLDEVEAEAVMRAHEAEDPETADMFDGAG